MLSHDHICAIKCGNLDQLVMVLINFCYTAIAELLDNAIDEVLIQIINIKIVLPPFEITRSILFHQDKVLTDDFCDKLDVNDDYDFASHGVIVGQNLVLMK